MMTFPLPSLLLLILCLACEAFMPYKGLQHVAPPLRALQSVSVPSSLSANPSSEELKTENVLIIADSTAKAFTIRNILEIQSQSFSFLSKYKFTVEICPETIAMLAPCKQPVATSTHSSEINFTDMADAVLNPKLDQSPSALRPLRDIQLKLKNSSRLVLAFNTDKRSELLVWNLLSSLDIPDITSVSRLRLSEISPEIFLASLIKSLSPTALITPAVDLNSVEGQRAQQVVDRAISFTMAQALYKCLGDYYSAGRVQSAALALVCEREKLMGDVQLSPSFSLRSRFRMKVPQNKFLKPAYVSVSAELCSVNGRSVFHPTMLNSADVSVPGVDEVSLSAKQASCIAKLCNSDATNFKLRVHNSEIVKQAPPKPLTTASLMEASSNHLQFSPRDTWRHARSLYDKGLITNPLTTSSHLTDLEKKVVYEEAKKRFGEEFVGPTADSLLDRTTGGDAPDTEAHNGAGEGRSGGAIRPVFSGGNFPVFSSEAVLSFEENKLFDLISASTLATAMLPSRRRVYATRIEAIIPRAKNAKDILYSGDPVESCVFNSTRQEIVFPGYSAAFCTPLLNQKGGWDQMSSLSTMIGQPAYLSPVLVGAAKVGTTAPQVIRKVAKVTRYTPSKLVETMSRAGSVDSESPHLILNSIDFLFKKGYIIFIPKSYWSAGRKGHTTQVVPSSKGMFTISYLKKHFDFLIHPSFSSTVQDKINEVSSGSRKKSQFLKQFMFGSDQVMGNDTALSAVFKGGFFRSITDRLSFPLKSPMIQSKTYVKETISHSVKSSYLGVEPGTRRRVFIANNRTGHLLYVGDNSFPLPSWVSTALPLAEIEEALEFTKLPRTICHHSSTDQPIVLSLYQGLLWLQVGTGRRSLARGVALEDGIFPSHVTATYALNKIRNISMDSDDNYKRH